MRIAVRVDAGRQRQWHERLVGALVADGHEAALVPVTGVAPVPLGAIALLLRLERLVYGSAGGALFEEAPGGSAPPDGGRPDLTIDLAAALPGGGAGPRWSLAFDDVPGEAGLLAALLDQQAPTISLADVRNGGLLATGLPALENPRLLGAGLDAVLTRAIGLCRRTVAAFAEGRLIPGGRSVAMPRPASSGAVRFGLTGLTTRIANRLGRLAGGGHQWQTGWRGLGPGSADAVSATLSWPAAGYTWLPDDGNRFYADPFVVEVAGRTVLFVEEYPYATGRGLISAVDLGPEGPTGTPRPVLEGPVHLSYPSVFSHDGTVWMIPETSGRRTVELYRADPFPHRWVLDRVLLDDVSAGDATLLDHQGRLYLFAVTNDDGGSTWDQLSIYHAPNLSGPWTPHDGNPVLIDAGCARPGGFAFHRDGSLLRPAQDCRSGYGAGLAFCSIDSLSPEEFEQTVVARLGPDPTWQASGAHTLNCGGGFEVIDRIARPI